MVVIVLKLPSAIRTIVVVVGTDVVTVCVRIDGQVGQIVTNAVVGTPGPA